jgi:hypothetical protein
MRKANPLSSVMSQETEIYAVASKVVDSMVSFP